MKWLENLAKACGVLAAAFLVALALVILAQIISRMFGRLVPSADDFAAWAMASSVFLGLPYAMLRGDHIRVTLVLQVLPKSLHYGYEILATLIALVVSAWGSYYCIIFVYESFARNELAPGMLPVPMWMPQIGMPIGLVLFTLMLARRLVMSVRGQPLEESENG
ncbi:MAG TPA: TRAP transporter small permease [Paenalcaligenes sp.]|nr:TRAP transporter small permease [Paenalcaligenes sp.]